MAADFRAGRTDSGMAGSQSTRQDSAHPDAALNSNLRAVRMELAKLLAQLPYKRSPSQVGMACGNSQSTFSQSLSTLTRKEREVLISFVEFLDNKEIAKHLGTKEQTVRNQLASIMDKLRVASREQLVAVVLTNSPKPLRNEEK